MCPGNPDASFIAMCQSRNGLIEAADGTVKAAVDSYYPVKLNGQHYMTTVRTASCTLLVSGSKCTPCKKYISWQHLVNLYHKHRGSSSAPRSGLSLLHKLKLEHIQLNAFSKMKVRLATQVTVLLLHVHVEVT